MLTGEHGADRKLFTIAAAIERMLDQKLGRRG
jgi:Asp-tRNA(Asn)/Glu-tRNA(Gln) amidotransferase A subunit family amidase